MSDLYDGMDDAEKRRDEALDRVAGNNPGYVEMAIAVIRQLPVGWTGIGEDIRTIAEKRLGLPSHHNVWGAIVRMAAKDGLIVKNGQRKNMTGTRSNARESAVWERVGNRTVSQATHGVTS